MHAREELPQNLKRNPHLDSWIEINVDGTITIFTGRVEVGQGISTAFTQIGAEELDVSISRVRVAMADTARSPDEFYTSGSNSIQETGRAIRQVAADARQALLELASEKLGVPVDRLEVEDGTVKALGSDRQTTYWELLGGKKFNRKATGIGSPKRPENYSIVGRPTRRVDIPAKVTGAACFIHDMELPGMVHSRVVRPPGYGARLVSVDDSEVRRTKGVLKVVRDGSFLAVIAEREEGAVWAAEKLRSVAVWSDKITLPPRGEIYEHLMRHTTKSFVVVDGTPIEAPIPPIEAPKDAAKTLEATYYKPYHMHASLGPSAAMARMADGRLTVWTHSQGVYPLRAALAQVLGMAEENIRAIHVEGAGCYGHNGADDAALDASLLARALPGRPVLLKWMRSDEHSWEPYGSAMVVKTQASLSSDGDVIDWNHDVWSYTHSGRPRPLDGASNLLAAWHLASPIRPPQAQPNMGFHSGIHRNADPLYSFPRRRIVKHFAKDSPLRVSSTRSLGAYANVFAIESFMDELSHAAGADPIEFRLRHLEDGRARSVIEAAAERAGWKPNARPAGAGRGRGVGFARYKNQKSYVAVIVDLTVDLATGEIRLKRAFIAADAGQIVDPDGLANQLEGGLIQSASWTLKEAVAFDREGITSIDWDSYPILTFSEVPEIETVLIDRPGEPYLGCGEAAQGPTPAAIANAIFDATGARLRRVPFAPEVVKASLVEKIK
jgi:CO/xanthine dehydrogenase Mo-binding subunit